MTKTDNGEKPFRKIRLTLSEVAIEKLARLRDVGYFRSDSSTVEECIRVMDDIADEISALVQEGEDTGKKVSLQNQAIVLQRIDVRASRFVRKPKKKQKS
jgi:hypothetical protein